MRILKTIFENLIFYSIFLELTSKESIGSELNPLEGSTRGFWTRSNDSKVTKITALSASLSKPCKLPTNKDFMIVRNALNDEEIALGTEIPKDIPILFACKTGYNLKGFNSTICGTGGRWTKSLPSCISFCSDQQPRSGFSTKAYFELNGIDVSHEQKFEVDTIAKISCANSFNKPAYFEHALQCTENGWSEIKVPCKMQCGKPAAPITPFSRGGNDANITEVPWHVGIYKQESGEYKNICGGVLISPRVVVSAAHCFFEMEYNERVTDLSKFAVAAGKYFREYNSSKESNITSIKIRRILDIWTPVDYAGRDGYFLGDLAILKLTEFIPFSESIRPVCLFSIKQQERKIDYASLTGKLSTWNQNSASEPNSNLKVLHMSRVSLEKCNETLAKDLQLSLPVDKFCLASYDAAAVACKGDSGSGFVVKIPETNEYVLQGIVSFSPIPTRECTHHKLLVVTNVSHYQEMLEQFKREDLENDVYGFDKELFEKNIGIKKTCKVPTKTDFMIIKKLFTDEIIKPGYNAPLNTFYSIACENDFILNGNNVTICNTDGHWLDNFPKCVAQTNLFSTIANNDICIIPARKRFLIVKDALNDELIKLGSFIPKNKSLVFSCEPGTVLKGANNSVCKGSNEWTENLPICYYNCSEKHPRSGFSTKANFDFEGDALVARISCAYFYGQPKDFHELLTCKENGWNFKKEACFMNCGRPEEPIRATRTKRDVNMNVKETPWHVNIYKNINGHFEHICGGTLISPRFVVSAAHCFFQAQHTNSTKIDMSLFSIVAGKFYREYNSRESNMSAIERRNIVDIWTPDGYNGAANDFFGDISIIKLDRFMIFSDTIRPACLYLAMGIYRNINSNIEGRVAAWRQTSLGLKKKSIRQSWQMETVSLAECNKTFTANTLISNLESDKFCLASNGGVAFACKIDSGSGFIARNPDGGFALFGVVLASLSTGRQQNCSRLNLLVVTNALHYMTKINDIRVQDVKNDIDFDL